MGTGTHTIGDFWSWAYSDLVSNTVRPLLAEFLVSVALGVEDGARIEWNKIDVIYRNYGIEVKSAGYLQTWKQDRLSVIEFDIGLRKGWDAETNTYPQVAGRSAEIYVFCVHEEQDSAWARDNVTKTAAWTFYPVATRAINERFGARKRVRLSGVQALTVACTFDELKSRIDALIDVT